MKRHLINRLRNEKWLDRETLSRETGLANGEVIKTRTALPVSRKNKEKVFQKYLKMTREKTLF